MATSTDFEIIVIGGGVAGLTAALFAARLGRRTLVLMHLMPGGQLATIEAIEDFPGFPQGVAGYDLGPMLMEQAVAAGAECRTAEATAVTPTGTVFAIDTDQGRLTAAAVILATGSTLRPLGVPGEERLEGKGVSHCASCDGPMLRGQPVVVVGAGDSGLQEALALARFAGEVTIFEQADHPHGQAHYLERVRSHPRIRIECGTSVVAIMGDDVVTAVRVRDASGVERDHAAQAVFVYAGLVPNASLGGPLVSLTDTGHVAVDAGMRTTLPGLFAAGDVRAGGAGQAVAAASDGAAAALGAHRYLAAQAAG